MMTQEKTAHVRWMIRRDLQDVLEIENCSFEAAWDEETFLSILRERNIIGMVAELGEKVVGYIIYALNKKNIEIMNLAVAPEFRKKGIASQFINKIKSKLGAGARTSILLKTRERNLAAQLFFKCQEFKAYEVLNDYYEDNGEAAYCFKYKFTGE